MPSARQARAALAPLVLAAAACAPRAPLAPPPDPDAPRLVLDTREPGDFARGHAPGALNLQWSHGQLAARVGSYVPERATPLAVRGSSADEAQKAAAVLRSLGYEDVTLPPPRAESATVALIDARALAAQLAGPDPPLVVDVRTPEEWAGGTIPGALLVGEDEAPARARELDPGRRIAVICEGGYRSSQLASLLLARGFRGVEHVIDGMEGWRSLP